MSTETLRHYERLGVLIPPLRSEGGHRLYPSDSPEVLQLVQTLQRLGFSLPTIAELFAAISRNPLQAVSHGQKSALLGDVRDRLASLTALQTALSSPEPSFTELLRETRPET